jgi:hypothetical protein
MSKRSWFLVVLALGGGILLQIPDWGGHAEHYAGDGHDHPSVGRVTASLVEENRGERVVVLEVTGMT